MAMGNARSIIVTSQPEAEPYARDEVSAEAGGAEFERLAPGVVKAAWPAGADGAVERVLAGWRVRPPVFARHVFPVGVEVALGADVVAQLVAACEAPDGVRAALDRGRAFSVQTRVLEDDGAAGAGAGAEAGAARGPKPFDVNRALSDALTAATGAPLDVRAPRDVVSVVIAPARAVAFIGASEAAANLSAWGGGAQRFQREDGQVSRAEFKLLEALSVFGIGLPAAGRALDLGAAPGGWTRLLAAKMARVTAVDPAVLDTRVAAIANVQAARMTAERFLATATAGAFEVVANDMRLDAVDSAQVMRAALRVLAPGGFALMTLKLPEHGARQRMDDALAVLRGGWKVAGARQLFHNRSEVTLWLRPL